MLTSIDSTNSKCVPDLVSFIFDTIIIIKMDQPPNIEMVYLAVSTLYIKQNPGEMEKASQWLGDLQKSVSKCRVIFILTDNFIVRLMPNFK